MKVFETDRLIVNTLEEKNIDYFIELYSAPEIINPIPKQRLELQEIIHIFYDYIEGSESIIGKKRNAWGIFEKNGNELIGHNEELIGLCLFLTNDDNDRELGYRFREKYWGKGYGTEIAKGVIDFSFLELKLDKITADVSVDNKKSLKILQKFLVYSKEFYNSKDGCIDIRYEVVKEDWLKRNA